MELVRKINGWDPFDILEDLQTDMNRVFNRSLQKREGLENAFQPHLEVREDAEAYILSADLPGLKKEDFSITVQGNRLVLKGERKQEKELTEKGMHYSERSYGSFMRSMEFPVEVAADKVKASYKDGVLEINLPKAENAKPKQVSVEVK
ncbi:MAG TPA: Hsp20/alpha crystallin family protein [Verrucomicrobiae bacterium]|jgi:HSP20 family protein|nr:Hsp20/alpha crystallin family protein [Verrucomicrobiae bacterium]